MGAEESVSGAPIVGILGGIGPESTIDYYRGIIAEFARRGGDWPAPRIVITSLDVQRLLGYMGSARLDLAAEYLVEEAERLAAAGATFGAIAANTPHIVFDRLKAGSSLPMLSIVEAVGEAARTSGLQRLGLFGTRYTVEASFYPDMLTRMGIEVVLPSADEIAWIHERYIGELLKNVFLPQTRDRMLSIARRLRDERGIDGLILGGTELPLLLRDTTDSDLAGVPLLDSTLIHVDAIVTRLLA
jgi:aspartate racemase